MFPLNINNNHPYYIYVVLWGSQVALSGRQCLQELVKDCLSSIFLLLGLVAIPPEPEKILTMPVIRMLERKTGGFTEPEYCEK